MITQKFDMALLVLKQKDQFIQEMKDASMDLKPLPISDTVPTMGLPVVALGFPLGMNSLKISSGVVAGNEEVEGLICNQSTAPISPGSSGGPLLLDDGSEVVGHPHGFFATLSFFKDPATAANEIIYRNDRSSKEDAAIFQPATFALYHFCQDQMAPPKPGKDTRGSWSHQGIFGSMALQEQNGTPMTRKTSIRSYESQVG